MSNFLDMLQQLLSGAQGGGGAAPAGGPPSALPGDVSSLLQGAQGAPQGDQGGMPQPAQGADAVPAAPQAPPQAPPIPAPSTPPQTDAGLGGFLQRMVQKATNRPDDTGTSFVDKLGQVGAGMTDQMGDSVGAQDRLQHQAQQRVAATQADAKQKQMNALADQLGMSPRERLIFLADPDAWIKANGPRLGFHQIAGGDTGEYGDPGSADHQVVTAPKVGVENGEGYSATPQKVTDTGGLQPSPQQQLQDAIKQAQEKALDAYHQHMAAAAQERARAETTRANKPALGNGGNWRGRVVGQGSLQ